MPEQSSLPFQILCLHDCETALHSSNLGKIVSRPHMLVFVSLSWCHIIQLRKSLSLTGIGRVDIIHCIHSVVLFFEGKTRLFYFLFCWRGNDLWQFASLISFWLNLTLCFTFSQQFARETCAHLVFIIHYKAAPPPLAVRLFKWDITEGHFLARYRLPYSLSNRNDWHRGEASWPVEKLVLNK